MWKYVVLVLTLVAGSTLAQAADPSKRAFLSGRNNAVLAAVIETCGGALTPAFVKETEIAKKLDAVSYDGGFTVAQRNNKRVTVETKEYCSAARNLYGPDGLTIPGAWTPPK